MVCRSITIIGVIVYYSYCKRLYFSLFNDVYIILIGRHSRKLRSFIDLFHFYFNSNISVTFCVIEMNFSVCISKVALEDSVSQTLDIV